MTDATQPHAGECDWHEHAFDLARGIAVYCGSPLIKGVSRVIARHPGADIGTAFNHKQIACKMWARDRLFESAGGIFGEIWIVGGWYGVFAGMLLDDSRFKIGRIENSDIDPGGRRRRRDAQPCASRAIPCRYSRYVRARLCRPAARPCRQHEL